MPTPLDSRPLLYLFTSEFPYGNEVFVENEIATLCERFRKVYIIPALASGPVNTSLPSNAELILLKGNYSKGKKLRVLLKNLLLILRILRHERRYSRQQEMAKKMRKQNFFLLLDVFLKAEELKPHIRYGQARFYSYWFSNEATLLSVLKKQGHITNYVSRAHGFDLYENNGKENYIPFRVFQLAHIDQVFCISKTGMNYLKALYPDYQHKITTDYLGVYDYGTNPFEGKQLVVVSCANIVAVKRVHLLAQALKTVRVSVTWFHFGDGNLKSELEELAKSLPSGIRVKIMGKISHQKLMDFYKQQPVSVFVNTSISEGIPVSIMEAISFGIPVIATDVGGVSEIVNPETGLLLDSGFKPEELGQLLNEFSGSALNAPPFRQGVRSFFRSNFSAEHNYPAFVDKLLSVKG